MTGYYSRKEWLRILDFPFLFREPISYLKKNRLIEHVGSLWEAAEIYGLANRIRQIITENLKPTHVHEQHKLEPPQEIIAFHNSLLIIAWLKNPIITKRFSLNIAKKSMVLLKKVDDNTLVMISRLLGVRLEKQVGEKMVKIFLKISQPEHFYMIFQFSLPLKEYLELTKRFWGDPNWKLVNQMVQNGRVYLDRQKVLRLLEEKIANHVEELIKRYQEIIGESESLPSPLQSIGEEIKKIVAEELKQRIDKSSLSGFVPGKIVYNAFPPCMKKIFLEAKEGGNLSHHQRFAIATFMIRLGASADEIVDIFRNTPDFNEKITRYQVEHLMGSRGGGKKYSPYSCSTMKTLGLCIAECGTKTPFQKYLINLREMKKEAKKT